MITLHTVVRNEERFVKSALLSALSQREVVRALVWDTGSTDDTVSQINSIKDERIEFQQKGKADRKTLVLLRKEQLKLTKTPWFLLIDGDEIWPKKNLSKLIQAMKKCSNLPAGALAKEGETIALVNRTRNVVGDLRHYLPDSEGHYQIGPWRGHLNIRAIRNIAGLSVRGVYPNEWYEYGGLKIQEYPECFSAQKDTPWRMSRSILNGQRKYCLKFVDTWYLHVTHLKRSKSWLSEIATIDRLKKHKWFYKLKGKKLLKMKKSELPKPLSNFA